jgi:hypothetical protein
VDRVEVAQRVRAELAAVDQGPQRDDGVGLVKLERAARHRRDVYADDLEPCAVVARGEPASAGEHVEKARTA